MYQIVTMWNLSRPDQEIKDTIENIKLRGYNSDTFLTGEFAWKIKEDEIRPLSVSNIADKYCPTRRDLYFYKGINRLRSSQQQKTWGQKVGNFVENYIYTLKVEKGEGNNYSSLINKGTQIHNNFLEKKKDDLTKIKKLENSSSEIKTGDTDWLLTLLGNNSRAELALNLLQNTLKECDSLDITQIKLDEEINVQKKKKEHIKQIGINLPATPDFIIPEFRIVGDIKTGVEFKGHFQLTCAGYALAYENVKGKGHDINWGIIYFFPTRNPSLSVRPVTFAQIYIFPIDDHLRKWFLELRDRAYNTISQQEPPEFPKPENRKHCNNCRFKNYCIENGLDL